MNSLLERLRRRLHELGRPLRESPSLEGSRRSSRADSDPAPERRTEIEPTIRRQGSDRTGTDEEARLPGQQPPPPASTRLKAAVFSKKRQPGPQRQAGTIWGPTSFLDQGLGATGDDTANRSPLMMFDPEPGGSAGRPHSEVMSWSMRPPSATTNTVWPGADPAAQLWWTPEQVLTQASLPDSPASPLGGATPLDGAPSLVQRSELPRPLAETATFDLPAGDSQVQAIAWRVD